MSLHIKSGMTPSSRLNTPSVYTTREFLLAPTQICHSHIRSRKLLSSHSLLCKCRFLQLFWTTPKSFDHIIKVKIPAPICLLQPMNGQLKFAYMSSILRINQTYLLYQLQLFLNVAIREHGFFIHPSVS